MTLRSIHRPATPSQVVQRLKLRQLQIIAAVAEHGSFLAAAGSLGITQPAVTKAVQEIEDILGVPLFDRLVRGVIANAYGVAVAERGRSVVAAVERLAEDIHAIAEGGAGTLVIGGLPTAAASVLPPALARLKKSHPGLAVRMVQGRLVELMPQLEANRLDLIVGRLYELETVHDVNRETIYHEPISLMVRSGHPLLALAAPTPADVTAFGLVLPSLEQRLGQEVDTALTGAGFTLPEALLRSTSTSFIRELVLSSDFVTVLPRLMLAGDIARGTIALVPVALVAGGRPAGIVTLRNRRHPPAVAALVQALREHVQVLRRSGLLDPDGPPV